MNALVINKFLNEGAAEIAPNEVTAQRLRETITYKFSRQGMVTRNCGVDYVTKHLFVVNGVMCEVVESKTGFFWKNISRPTMKMIIKEMYKSQIKKVCF